MKQILFVLLLCSPLMAGDSWDITYKSRKTEPLKTLWVKVLAIPAKENRPVIQYDYIELGLRSDGMVVWRQ